MDNGGGKPPANGQSHKELSIALTASSMINASDIIDAEQYQANVHRIQEVRDIVRTLESNNEAAHRNFLVDQLEKRARDGREAENMLAHLKRQPRLPATIQFSSNLPSGRTEDILPTTATLVEVPESHSSPSHSSLAPSTARPPPVVQQSHPAIRQWSGPQIQRYPDVFRPYVPPTTTHPALHQTAALPQAPVDARHWYTPQNPSPWLRGHNLSTQISQPTQAQQPILSWINYAPQVIVPSATDVASGYHTSSEEWTKTAPSSSAPSSSSSNLAQRGLGFSTQTVTSQPPSTVRNTLDSTAHMSASFQSVPVVSAKPMAQTSVGSYSKPPSSQSQPISTTVSNQVAISELQRSRKLPEQSQQRQQPPSQRFSVSQLPPQPQLQQPLVQPQPRTQQSLNPPLPPPPSADRVPPTNTSQSHTELQPVSVQEQSWQRGSMQMPQVDQATFIKDFQDAAHRGAMQFRAFWFHAKASGISDEWFRIAVTSLPPNIWSTTLMQLNRAGATHHTALVNASQQQIPSSNVPVVSAVHPPTAISLDQTSYTTQRATESSISSVSGPYNSYAPQLQYYAEQATKSAHLQTLGIPVAPHGNATRITVTTPKRDAAPQVTANGRTPKDANKSTLARDVLHALGKSAQQPSQEMGNESVDKVDNNRESDKLPEVDVSQSLSPPTAAKPPTNLLEAVPAEASPSIASANPIVQDVPQGDMSPFHSIVQSVLEVEPRQPAVDEGPIMIDLTVDDEPIDGKGQEPNFLIQTSTNVISPSRINTTNRTPLLENLSLEEPAVPLAGDGDNADVRMRSPALPISVEEGMSSELVYPLLGGVESVSQRFEQLPDEGNEDELNGQLPLFLPSPPASSAPTEPPITDFEEDETRPPVKRHPVDADKMETDGETEIPPRVRKRRKQQVYVLIPPAPHYVKRARMRERILAESRDSDLEGAGQDEELQYSHLEQLLVEESKSRLLERRCRWSSCGAILNSAANLLAHLRNHAREGASEVPFTCRWASCERQFGMEHERDMHLERHATKPLPCSFAGCDKQFDKPVEVMQHEVQHQKTDPKEPLVRKPTCEPIVPAIPARLGPPPHWVPSHRVIPRRVAKCQISADRHAIVGPWVLWNIFSPVDLNMRKQNASMRGRHARQATNCDMDSLGARHDDYDFLVAVSAPCTKEAPLDDMDSGAITMSAARGLTLWGSATGVPAEDEAALSGRQSREESSVERML